MTEEGIIMGTKTESYDLCPRYDPVRSMRDSHFCVMMSTETCSVVEGYSDFRQRALYGLSAFVSSPINFVVGMMKLDKGLRFAQGVLDSAYKRAELDLA